MKSNMHMRVYCMPVFVNMSQIRLPWSEQGWRCFFIKMACKQTQHVPGGRSYDAGHN